ncbi:MAG: tRNA pseudouridine(55) synthase TruB [Candidatus Gracilibacteria bacterium]
MDGFLFIDKEKGDTSFDVIRALKPKIREAFPNLGKKYKIGHCGTLDPIATGLMIVALGEATKFLEFLIGADKVYRAECEFGAVSDTYDGDGKIEKTSNSRSNSRSGSEVKLIKLSEIKKIVKKKFVGEIEQMPPKYSAKKVGGKRACDLMREGKEFELKAKKVSVYDFVFISFEWPRMQFELSCSSGTYVRSLVHDLGQELLCGAYMTALRRTEIGFLDGGKSKGFSVDDALKVDDVEVAGSLSLPATVHSIEEVFEKFPSIELGASDYNRLKSGGFVLNVLNTKSVQGSCLLAKYRGKVVGVLERIHNGKFVKFRKTVKILSGIITA